MTAQARESLARFAAALDALPALQREAFLLYEESGLSVAEIAASEGKDGVDALLDITLADDLDNEFTMQSFNTRVDRMKEVLNDRSMLLGLGDGGAHLDMLCDSGYPTYVLLDSNGNEVRRQEGYLPGGPAAFIRWIGLQSAATNRVQ